MSTVTLNYPDVIRVRRAPVIGQILILSTLALIGITILLTMISANADLNDRAAVSQNSVAPMSVPVPTHPTADIQPLPSETPSPSSGLASEPSIIPVPVQTPPSQ
jgi:hypothetical protein